MADHRSGILSNVHVLVVDDNDDAREVLSAFLAHHGALVTVASNGAEALALVQRLIPDVLVSDLAMDGLSGLQLLGQLRAVAQRRDQRLPAIALTAYPLRMYEDEARRSGFDRYFIKPVQMAALVDAVAGLAGERRS